MSAVMYATTFESGCWLVMMKCWWVFVLSKPCDHSFPPQYVLSARSWELGCTAA